MRTKEMWMNEKRKKKIVCLLEKYAWNPFSVCCVGVHAIFFLSISLYIVSSLWISVFFFRKLHEMNAKNAAATNRSSVWIATATSWNEHAYFSFFWFSSFHFFVFFFLGSLYCCHCGESNKRKKSFRFFFDVVYFGISYARTNFNWNEIVEKITLWIWRGNDSQTSDASQKRKQKKNKIKKNNFVCMHKNCTYTRNKKKIMFFLFISIFYSIQIKLHGQRISLKDDYCIL